MRIKTLELIAITATLAACAAPPDAGESRSPDTPVTLIALGDDEIIRGPGVPTASDDTMGTRYGKHHGPARILPAPDCMPAGFAMCIADTAATAWSLSGDEEGGMNDQRRTEWLVFAAENDSMQVFITPPGGGYGFPSYLWMSPNSAGGFPAEHAINDASWIRARFGHAGTYIFSAQIESASPIPYELRVAPVVARGATRPRGTSATLVIEGDSTRRVAIVPLAIARNTDGDSVWLPWAVKAKTYRVLLVRDSTYVHCLIPCINPTAFTLHPGRTTVIRP